MYLKSDYAKTKSKKGKQRRNHFLNLNCNKKKENKRRNKSKISNSLYAVHDKDYFNIRTGETKKE